jgi:hypothetical protein
MIEITTLGLLRFDTVGEFHWLPPHTAGSGGF